MKIHSEFILFTCTNSEAYALFKGAEIKIKSRMADERLFNFVDYYQIHEFLTPYCDPNIYSSLEIEELKSLFTRLNLTTNKLSDLNEENYLANLDESNSFNITQIRKSIRWFSFLNDNFNQKIGSLLKYEKIDDLNNLDLRQFCIIFTDPYNVEANSQLAATLYKKKCPWLLVSIKYLQFSIGPIYTSSASFCLQCIIDRRISNQSNPEVFQKFLGNGFAKKYDLPAFFINIICGYVQSEMIKFFTNDSSDLTKGIFDIGLYQPKTDFSYLLPLPNCRVCNES